MKKLTALFLALAMVFSLAACGGDEAGSSVPTADSGFSQTEGQERDPMEQSGTWTETNILIAYDPAQEAVARAARLLADTLGGDLAEIGGEGSFRADAYEYVLLGFASRDGSLPQPVQDFLGRWDFGARTIYPFVLSSGPDSAAVSSDSLYSAISELQPGALMGGSALVFSPDTGGEEISQWADGLGLSGKEDPVPAAGEGNTAATAAVTPGRQQVLYLWEEGNAPAQTEYTVNNGGYFDNPDFRPYLTSYPVPEGTEIRGAVLICPGGAFQFRSDQPEGTDVAEALSALGYQSFVVDYRLRPYTQQEGALDLACGGGDDASGVLGNVFPHVPGAELSLTEPSFHIKSLGAHVAPGYPLRRKPPRVTARE